MSELRGVNRWRPLLAGIAALGAMLVLGGLVRRIGATPGEEALLAALGFLLLIAVPALWKPVPRGRWLPVRIAVQTLLLAILLAAAGVALPALLWPWLEFGSGLGHGIVPALAGGFIALRSGVLLVRGGFSWSQRRLRHQLMLSQITVLLLTLALLTAGGSVVGVAIAIHGMQPNAVAMAASARRLVLLAGGPEHPARVSAVFDDIRAGRLKLNGQPGLSFFIGRGGIPGGIGLADPSGKLLIVRPAGAAQSVAGFAGQAVWRSLRAGAGANRITAITLHAPREPVQRGTILAEAPIVRHGTLAAIVVVQTSALTLTSLQSLEAALALFSAGTIALLVLLSLPVLGFSLLFSYLVARSVTRRLEDVSRVAEAIADGDLSQRARITARNEIGQLATDVNRMAQQLERLVSDLRAAQGRAEEALRARQELIAGVSHELRTPLAVIGAQLDLADEGNGRAPALTAQTVSALRTETDRIGTLIEDLFALSRADTGALPFSLQAVDIARLAEDVVRALQPLARQEGAVALVADLPASLPPARADPARLRQILANLVRNAIRYTPEGGIVVVSAFRQGDRVALAVADTGTGIAPDHLPHIFDRFYRPDTSRTRDTGGAGLGLAIVREFVERMGGSVEVESVVGEGSRFQVLLPPFLG